jgi:hypothetical protein
VRVDITSTLQRPHLVSRDNCCKVPIVAFILIFRYIGQSTLTYVDIKFNVVCMSRSRRNACDYSNMSRLVRALACLLLAIVAASQVQAQEQDSQRVITTGSIVVEDDGGGTVAATIIAEGNAGAVLNGKSPPKGLRLGTGKKTPRYPNPFAPYSTTTRAHKYSCRGPDCCNHTCPVGGQCCRSPGKGYVIPQFWLTDLGRPIESCSDKVHL